VAVVLCCC